MAGSCIGMGTLVGTFQAAGSSLLNAPRLRTVQETEKLDESSPLRSGSQERRAAVLKPHIPE
ncbi:hypothetical protein MSPP1_004164 [Malassezia sp. CBS 17886]|nr:hypothetical protein MSPP1_004164 [Malassezia sp. CBS 17886]